eukprot:3999811-Prymnesium_polylepis.1
MGMSSLRRRTRALSLQHEPTETGASEQGAEDCGQAHTRCVAQRGQVRNRAGTSIDNGVEVKVDSDCDHREEDDAHHEERAASGREVA